MNEPTANLDINKAAATAALTAAARHLHRAVLSAFVETGSAPTRADLVRIADRNDVAATEALTELADRDVVAFDTDGEIRAAYPFSPTPTAIRVSWVAHTLHAMCAVDALGISAMLDRPVTIIATEPGTNATITVHVNRDQARWTPESAVVFAGTTGDRCCPSVDSTCGHINFFTSADAARTWAADHPEVVGVVLDQTDALACAVAEFGTLMRTPNTR